MTSPITFGRTRPLTYGLTGPFGTVMGQGRRIAPDPALISPYRQILMGGKTNGANTVLGAGLTHALSRMWSKWGPTYTPLEIALVYYNGCLSHDPDIGEVPNTNDVTIRASIQNNVNSNIAPFTMSGASPGADHYTMEGGEWFRTDFRQFTDIGFTTSSKNGAVQIKTDAQVADDTMAIPVGWLKGGTGEQVWRAPDSAAASQVFTAGTYDTSGGGVITLNTMAPAYMVGRFVLPATNGRPRAQRFAGDSIAAGLNGNNFNNVTGSGGGGYQLSARQLIIPFSMDAVASSMIVDPDLMPFFTDSYKYFDDAHSNHGHNNFSAGHTSDHVKAMHKRHIYEAKRRGVLTYRLSTIIPDCTATGDDYSSEGNQDPRPSFDIGEDADVYNLDFVLAQAGIAYDTHDAAVDVNAALCGLNRRKWARVADVSVVDPKGIHPTETGQNTQGVTIKADMQTLSPLFT